MSSQAEQPLVSGESACGRGVIAATAEMLQSIEGLRVLYDPPLQSGKTGVFSNQAVSSLATPVRQYVAQKFPAGLFSHQHKAIESIV
ncbi:MAG: hypothetical protein ACKPJD_14915, partial [Planctomycetaceae bacterium]